MLTPVFSRSIGRHQFFWPLIFETPATIIRQSSNTFVCIWDKFYLPGYWKSSEEHGNLHIWYAEYTNGAKLWRKTPFGHNFLELLCTYICIDCGFWIKKFCCLVIKIYPKHASSLRGVLLWVTSAKPFRKCEEVQANSQEHTGKCMEKPGVD